MRLKLEAVNLVKDRGVSIVQAARDLDLNHNMLRRWLKELDADPKHAFPGLGQMKRPLGKCRGTQVCQAVFGARRDSREVGTDLSPPQWPRACVGLSADTFR